MYGAKNYYCEECNYEDTDGGDCPRCGSGMQDISGKEYLQQNNENELEDSEFDLHDDFDFSDLPGDGFEEAI